MKKPNAFLAHSMTRIALCFKNMGGTKEGFNNWVNAIWDDMDMRDPKILEEVLALKLKKIMQEN